MMKTKPLGLFFLSTSYYRTNLEILPKKDLDFKLSNYPERSVCCFVMQKSETKP